MKIANKEDIINSMALKDCEELKKLIVENPSLPLLVFAGEDAWNEEYAYSSCNPGCVLIEELTLYNDEFVDKSDYEEFIRDDLSNDHDYDNLSDDEFDLAVHDIVNKTPFVKAITIFVG